MLLLAVTGILQGCGPRQEESASVSPAPAAVSASGTASLQGEILFEGAVPSQTVLQMDGNPECRSLHPPGPILGGDVLIREGKVQNAFVYIKEGLEGKIFETPSTPAVLDNHTCVYEPHVTGAMVNQPVEIRNSDPTLHNVHALPEKQAEWNVGLPFQGMKLVKKFPAPEVMVRLKCDVHPWMAGYIGVLPHPYFSVTGPDGRFELKNLPAGSYTVAVWHERFGVKSETIPLAEGETKELNFTFQ